MNKTQIAHDSYIAVKTCGAIIAFTAIGVFGLSLLCDPLDSKYPYKLKAATKRSTKAKATLSFLSASSTKPKLERDPMRCMSGGWNECN